MNEGMMGKAPEIESVAGFKKGQKVIANGKEGIITGFEDHDKTITGDEEIIVAFRSGSEVETLKFAVSADAVKAAPTFDSKKLPE